MAGVEQFAELADGPTAIVFGLAFATVLTLLVTPSLLMLRARRIEKRRAEEAGAAEPAQGDAAPAE